MRTPAVWQALLCCVRIKPPTELKSWVLRSTQSPRGIVKNNSELLNRYFWSFAVKMKTCRKKVKCQGVSQTLHHFWGEEITEITLFYLVFNAVPNVKDAINRSTAATSILGNLQDTMIILYLHKCFHPESLIFFFLHMTVTRTVSWLQTLIRSHC